jgi:mono/diheme cytochrome c family protein
MKTKHSTIHTTQPIAASERNASSHSPRASRPCRTALLFAVRCSLLAAFLLLPACRGERSEKPPHQFFQGMEDQPKWRPQSKSEFFADGRTMRPVVPNTVPFGRSDLDKIDSNPKANEIVQIQRASFLKEDTATYTGMTEDGTYVDRIPAAVTGDAEHFKQLLARGQERFNIYCAVCHGYEGDGHGMVGDRWSYALPTYHDPKYYRGGDKGQDGYLFHVSRVGVIDPASGQQKMPGYAHALSERDSWAIIAYIRALQESRLGKIEDVPSADRAKVLETRPRPAPPAPPAAAPSTPMTPSTSPNTPVPSTNPGGGTPGATAPPTPPKPAAPPPTGGHP